MRDGECLLGIDVGGTAVKVALFDAAGRLLAVHNRRIPVQSPRPGWAEIDARLWWEAVSAGAKDVLERVNCPSGAVRAIGLSGMIGTMTPIDARGRPLRAAIPYYDTRSSAEAAWMLERAPEIPRVTGNRVLPGNTALTSILWLRRHEPEAFARSAAYVPANSLLFRWLTGELRIDWTNASFVGLYDYCAREWSADLAQKLDLDPARLGPIGAPHDTAPLLPEAAAALGLAPGTPVALGGLDGAMSSVGVGAIAPGDAYDVSGTSEMIAVCLPRPVVCPELLGRWHVVPELWTLIGAISSAGAALQWLCERILRPDEGADARGAYDALSAEAADSPPGAGGVVFLPYLAGERAPIWDPHARGVFHGLSLRTTRGDLARAVMEGVAYAMRQLLELIVHHGGVAPERIVTLGGAARNRLWCRIKADVWGIPLVIPQVAGGGVGDPAAATALGAALTAGVGAGLYRDYAEAVVQAVPRGGEMVTPDPTHRAVYDRGYALYRRLYPALAETMHLAAAE